MHMQCIYIYDLKKSVMQAWHCGPSEILLRLRQNTKATKRFLQTLKKSWCSLRIILRDLAKSIRQKRRALFAD